MFKKTPKKKERQPLVNISLNGFIKDIIGFPSLKDYLSHHINWTGGHYSKGDLVHKIYGLAVVRGYRIEEEEEGLYDAIEDALRFKPSNIRMYNNGYTGEEGYVQFLLNELKSKA